MNRVVTENTETAYDRRVAEFREWCDENRIRFPATHKQFATYLAHLERTGVHVAIIMQALTAVGRAYRARGIDLDTKHPAIQEVMRPLRLRRAARDVTKEKPAITPRRGDPKPVNWWSGARGSH